MKHTYYKNYDEHVYTHTLTNGLKIIALPKTQVKSTYVAIALPFGSCHLNINDAKQTYALPFGSAHFFEHKIYASQEGDMFSKFVQLGLDPNAMTSYESTIYYFSATNHIFDGIELLFQTLDQPYFTNENVLSERSIIQEEIHMSQDETMTPIYQRLYENMYMYHPIKVDILGTSESISTINKEILIKIHQCVYQDYQKTLILSGNIDMYALEKYIDKLESIRPKSKYVIQYEITQDPITVVKANDEIKKEISIPRILIGIKLPPCQDEIHFHRMKNSLYITLHAMIGDTSDAQQHWMDKGFIHQDIQFHISHVKGADHITIEAQSHHPEILLKEIETILKQDVRLYIDEKKFLRQKKIIMASNILSLDDQENKMFQYLKNHLKGINMFDVMDAVRDIDFNDVINFGNQMQTFQSSTLIAKP
jgi:predicted Zn-dependent peptidase